MTSRLDAQAPAGLSPCQSAGSRDLRVPLEVRERFPTPPPRITLPFPPLLFPARARQARLNSGEQAACPKGPPCHVPSLSKPVPRLSGAHPGDARVPSPELGWSHSSLGEGAWTGVTPALETEIWTPSAEQHGSSGEKAV